MDSDSDVACSKRLESSEVEDRISQLPDFIISHILSFVPTEDAVRTCVLSKRWINLWKFITHILFRDTECYNFPDMENPWFENLVTGVMLHLHDSNIQSFSVIINHRYHPRLHSEWISAALSRRVKKLCVDSQVTRLPADSLYELPFSYSLEQFQSLEELVLVTVDTHYACAVDVPKTICFSSLTVLKLYQILLNPTYHRHLESCTYSKNLTLKFPVLRELEATNCTWRDVDSVALEASLLQVVSNFSVNHPESDEIVVTFCASRIKKFSFFGTLLQLPRILDLSAANIASADIRMFHEACEEEDVNHACMLLEQFACNVECLRVQWSQVVKLANDSFVCQTPSQMLTRLVLDSVNIEILLGLLLNAPMLKTLMFMEILQFDKELLSSAMVPDCFRSNLREVTFLYMDGSEHELSFAKFVLGNARVLERILFHPNRLMCNTKFGQSKLKEAKEKIFSFKKACSSAEIVEFLDWA